MNSLQDVYIAAQDFAHRTYTAHSAAPYTFQTVIDAMGDKGVELIGDDLVCGDESSAVEFSMTDGTITTFGNADWFLNRLRTLAVENFDAAIRAASYDTDMEDALTVSF